MILKAVHRLVFAMNLILAPLVGSAQQAFKWNWVMGFVGLPVVKIPVHNRVPVNSIQPPVFLSVVVPRAMQARIVAFVLLDMWMRMGMVFVRQTA